MEGPARDRRIASWHLGSTSWASMPCAGSEYAGIYLHARYYDPRLGIFLSPDPIGPAGGTNLYGYGLGDPVNGTDRYGRQLDSCVEDTGCRGHEDVDVVANVGLIPIGNGLALAMSIAWDMLPIGINAGVGDGVGGDGGGGGRAGNDKTKDQDKEKEPDKEKDPKDETPAPPSKRGAVGTIAAFVDNYRKMREANFIGADGYFHCMANCQGSRQGFGGAFTAGMISEARELSDQHIKGDQAAQCDSDRIANDTGRGQVRGVRSAGDSDRTCSAVCAVFRPAGLPSKY